ncbi:hypothetical protein C7S15_6669 [Burkholderia cepacia]|nr:hypothetical protein [Burkholderia cepacia]
MNDFIVILIFTFTENNKHAVWPSRRINVTQYRNAAREAESDISQWIA